MTDSSEGYLVNSNIRSWEMLPLQMKNKKGQNDGQVSPRECSLSSMTKDIVSINSPKWNYIHGTKNQPWSQIEIRGNTQRLTMHFSWEGTRKTKDCERLLQLLCPQEDYTNFIPKESLYWFFNAKVSLSSLTHKPLVNILLLQYCLFLGGRRERDKEIHSLLGSTKERKQGNPKDKDMGDSVMQWLRTLFSLNLSFSSCHCYLGKVFLNPFLSQFSHL